MEQNNLQPKYLAYIGLYREDGRGIGLNKSFDELNAADIDRAHYMYCRDLETGESVIFYHDEIKNAIEHYGNYLLRRVEGTYVIGKLARLSKVLEDLKKVDADEIEIIDSLWATLYEMEEKEKPKPRLKSKR